MFYINIKNTNEDFVVVILVDESHPNPVKWALENMNDEHTEKYPLMRGWELSLSDVGVEGKKVVMKWGDNARLVN